MLKCTQRHVSQFEEAWQKHCLHICRNTAAPVSDAVAAFLLVWKSFQTPSRIILTLMLNVKKNKIIHLHSPFSVAYPGSSCLNIHVLPSHHLQLFKKKPEEPAEPHVHRVLPMGHTQMPHPAGILIRCPNQLDWRQNDHKQIQNNHKVNPADSQSW